MTTEVANDENGREYYRRGGSAGDEGTMSAATRFGGGKMGWSVGSYDRGFSIVLYVKK